jgi:ubiquinone/menaquinone biosynthesis C-methylase UbiE
LTMLNVDAKVTEGFGQEWSSFPQGSDLSSDERRQLFEQYFRIFPWDKIPAGAVGIDAGCGTGRWATLLVQRVGHLHLLDASQQALSVAERNLASAGNVTFHHGSVSAIPLPDSSLDFAYSLGVLHHVPDTLGALREIATKLKPGAPFLLYLYYALDNRPIWFRAIWHLTNAIRLLISNFPVWAKLAASQFLATTIYWPLAKLSAILSKMGISTRSIPLEAYKDRSFYTMRTDAYDRFCTSLEKRFTRPQIDLMLREAGFEQIVFSDKLPFWCCVSIRSPAKSKER